jgi:hypothetical protein
LSDRHAHLKDNAWRELAELDAKLELGEIDDDGWHRAIEALIVPAYLAGDTPRQQSGRSGTAADWEYARSHIADAIDRPGSFLDVGCASGYLIECVARWAPVAVEPYGLEIAPALADLARRRLPHWADRIWVGNARSWSPDRRFAYVRTGLEYAPPARRQELVEHLLSFCDRLIVGVFNEQAHERPTEEEVRSWGYRITGRSERPHRTKPGMAYRLFWIDAA